MIAAMRQMWVGGDSVKQAAKCPMSCFGGAGQSSGIRSGIAAVEARGKRLGRQLGENPKSTPLTPSVFALIEQGRSYRLVGREVELSKNNVASIVKHHRPPQPARGCYVLFGYHVPIEGDDEGP